MKSRLYTLLIFLAFVIPIYLFADATITGHVTEEEDEIKDIGTYSILPHTSTEMPHNLSTYEIIKNASAKLYKDALECEARGTLIECIRQKMDRMHWYTDCLEGRELVFEQFVDEYTLCALSEDDYCYCELTLPEEELMISDTFRLDKRETKPIMVPVVDAEGTGIVINTEEHHFLLSDKLKVMKNIEEVKSIDYNGKAIVYKNKDKMVFVPSKALDARTCVPANKRQYVFCAKYGEKVYTRKDEQEIGYKFAMDFRDDEAPEQVNFNLREDEGTIVVQWEPVQDADLDHYSVYCSMTGEFDSPNTRTNSNSIILDNCVVQGTAHNFLEGSTYHIAVVAVDKSNNMGEFLSESIKIPKTEN